MTNVVFLIDAKIIALEILLCDTYRKTDFVALPFVYNSGRQPLER